MFAFTGLHVSEKIMNIFPMGSFVKTMSAKDDGGQGEHNFVSTTHAMFALNWLIGFCMNR